MLKNQVIDQTRSKNAGAWETRFGAYIRMFHSGAGCPPGEMNIVQQKVLILALQANSFTLWKWLHLPGNQWRESLAPNMGHMAVCPLIFVFLCRAAVIGPLFTHSSPAGRLTWTRQDTNKLTGWLLVLGNGASFMDIASLLPLFSLLCLYFPTLLCPGVGIDPVADWVMQAWPLSDLW